MSRAASAELAWPASAAPPAEPEVTARSPVDSKIGMMPMPLALRSATSAGDRNTFAPAAE